MGDLPAPIDAMQWGRRGRRIKMEMIQHRATTEGVTGRMFQKPDRFRRRWVFYQTLLPPALLVPSRVKTNRSGRLKKNCASRVFLSAARH